MAHKDDDAATLHINLSAGCAEVDGVAVSVWRVEGVRPAVGKRKAALIAELLALEAQERAGQSLEVLRAEIEQRRKKPLHSSNC